MARLVVSPQAELDAAAITAMLIDEAGSEVGRRFRRDVDDLFGRLTMFPRSGARRPGLGRNARIGVIAPYVVVYDYERDEVLIQRIIDGRRNITRRLVRE